MSGLVCFVVGARPNFMKTAPVHRALGEAAPEVGRMLVHTGQHYDAAMSDVFLRELDLPAPDVYLGVGAGSHGEQTAKVLVGVEQVLLEHRPDLVVVPGDVNSTAAAALAAVKLGIPVAHLEAGLRSFDWAMPEEHNRKIADVLSTILLAHSQGAVDNLAHEGHDLDTVFLVGNTMIDSLFAHLDRATAEEPWRALGLERGGYGLVTLHRPALVDDEHLLPRTAHALMELAETHPIVFPVHPRTLARLEALDLAAPLTESRVILAEPAPYLAFLGLEAGAAFVLTDSGGVQEETSALGVPCFTLRDSTERPVTVELGTNTVLGAEPDRIRDVPGLLAQGTRGGEIPLWDGHASERAADTLLAFLSRRHDSAPVA